MSIWITQGPYWITMAQLMQLIQHMQAAAAEAEAQPQPPAPASSLPTQHPELTPGTTVRIHGLQVAHPWIRLCSLIDSAACCCRQRHSTMGELG